MPLQPLRFNGVNDICKFQWGKLPSQGIRIFTGTSMVMNQYVWLIGDEHQRVNADTRHSGPEHGRAKPTGRNYGGKSNQTSPPRRRVKPRNADQWRWLLGRRPRANREPLHCQRFIVHFASGDGERPVLSWIKQNRPSSQNILLPVSELRRSR